MTRSSRRQRVPLLAAFSLALLLGLALFQGGASAQSSILDLTPEGGTVEAVPEEPVDRLRPGMRGDMAPAVGPAVASDGLRIGHLPILPNAQLYLLHEAGWDADAGIEVQLRRFRYGSEIAEALVAGEIDMAYVDAGHVIRALERDTNLADEAGIQIIASAAIDSVALLVRGDLANYVSEAFPTEGIDRYVRQRGERLTIATFPRFTVPYAATSIWAYETSGMSRRDVRVAGVGLLTVWRALLAERIEAAVVPEPILTMILQRDPSAKIVLDSTRLLTGQPTSVVAVRSELLARERPLLEAFMALHLRATRLLQTEPEQAARFLTRHVGYGRISTGEMAEALRSPVTRWTADPAPIADAMVAVNGYMVDEGLMTRRFMPFDYVNDSVYRQAAAEN